MPLQLKCPQVQHAGEPLDRRTNLLPGFLQQVAEPRTGRPQVRIRMLHPAQNHGTPSAVGL